MKIMLYIILATNVFLVIGMFILTYMKIREIGYLKRIISYGDGLADIHKRLKEMALEHHTLVEQMVYDSTQEIIRHVTYTNRWQKVMAKMIRVGGIAPLGTATGVETVKEASELHDIGLDIAKVAFDDKQTIEEENKEADAAPRDKREMKPEPDPEPKP